MAIRSIFMFLVLSLIPANVLSADVKVGMDTIPTTAIFITGPIEKGDYEKIEKTTRRYVNSIVKDRTGHLKFIINSEGGDVEEAIKIGLLLRKMLAEVGVWGNRLIHESEKEAQWVLNYRTKGLAEEYETQNSVVYSDKRPLAEDDFKKCYSACVLMFLGGVSKHISDNHYWIGGSIDKKKNVPVIGLHRPYFSQKQYAKLSIKEAENSYQRLEKLVKQYLEKIGATQELIDRMFKSPSNKIDLVKDSDFRNMSHKEEPFYNEWIIAKCGVFDDGKGLLSEADYSYQKEVYDAKTSEVFRMIDIHGGGFLDYIHILKDYIPDGFSREKYDKIMSTIRAHNFKAQNCKENAIRNHQIDMFAEKQR